MPDPGHSDAVATLFAAAVELPADARRAFVHAADAPESVRREVASLLAVYETAAGQAEDLRPDLAAAILDEDSQEGAETGRRIGPYRLLHELGRGVWEWCISPSGPRSEVWMPGAPLRERGV